MTKITITPKKLHGTIQVPPSKSLAHRAIICASLAPGMSRISGIDYSEDIEATIEGMKALGAIIKQEGDTLIIDGSLTLGLGRVQIDAHESGSTLRFLIPLSVVNFSRVRFIGKGKLGQRPLDVYYDIFDKQNIAYLKKDAEHLDLLLNGELHSDIFEVPGNVSSQFISGLLFTLPLLKGDSIIKITTPLESKGYIDLTLDMLERFGIEVINHDYQAFQVRGGQNYKPCNYDVEADFSQAAFYLVADLLGSDITLTNLNMHSSQGDRAILDIMKQMGGEIVETKEGIKVVCDEIKPATIDASQCPDLMPVVSVACALAHGTSHIVNAGRLRIKECDRLHASVEVLKETGIDAIEEEESMTIIGKPQFKSAHVSSYNDHRMCMAEAILSTCADGEIVIDDKDCVKKSYPGFFEDFTSLGGEYHEC